MALNRVKLAGERCCGDCGDCCPRCRKVADHFTNYCGELYCDDCFLALQYGA
jgi:hypothetical protein